MENPRGVEKIPAPFPLEIYHSGPDLQEGPLPAFFYFALSGEESLALDPFNRPVIFLKNRRIRTFSFTLPFHGHGRSPAEAMELWTREFDRGSDFFIEFLDHAGKNIDFLLEQGYIDPDRISIGGLSRGAYIATHIAARNPLIQSLVGFAPLTKFGFLRKSEKDPEKAIGETFDLVHLAEKLVGKNIRFYIGNRDVLTGTEECFAFIQKVAEVSYQKGVRTPQTELIISPSIGHKGHGTSPEIFDSGAKWILDRLEQNSSSEAT